MPFLRTYCGPEPELHASGSINSKPRKQYLSRSVYRLGNQDSERLICLRSDNSIVGEGVGNGI